MSNQYSFMTESMLIDKIAKVNGISESTATAWYKTAILCDSRTQNAIFYCKKKLVFSTSF